MSTHSINVIKIKLRPHPNADSLSIVDINEYTCVVRTQDWKDGQLAAYIEPDYCVPTDRPEFDFLKQYQKPISISGKSYFRIKVKKLRGVWSMGLLVPVDNFNEGDDVLSHFNIVRYEPPMIGVIKNGESCSGPNLICPKYDVESGYKYVKLFRESEDIVITEKIHGASQKIVYSNGQMYVGSRTLWKEKNPEVSWWKALTPQIEQWCIDHPNYVLYGECYGSVQDLNYGHKKGEVSFACFDILHNGRWLNFEECQSIGRDLPWVPMLYRGKFDKDTVMSFVSGESILAKERGVSHIREGIVIKPTIERWERELGRVQVKFVSPEYLAR